MPGNKQSSKWRIIYPVELYDFESGGLDLFSESYILLSEKRTIRKRDIVCRKGRLSWEFIMEITNRT